MSGQIKQIMAKSPLKQKRKQLIEQLQGLGVDMLRGSLIKRYRRCGKSNCHCVKEQGHESYYLSASMSGRSPIMIYISLKNQSMVRKSFGKLSKCSKNSGRNQHDQSRTLVSRGSIIEGNLWHPKWTYPP